YGQPLLTSFDWAMDQTKESTAWDWNERYHPAAQIWTSPPVQHFISQVHKMGLRPPAGRQEPASPPVQTASRPPKLAARPPSRSPRNRARPRLDTPGGRRIRPRGPRRNARPQPDLTPWRVRTSLRPSIPLSTPRVWTRSSPGRWKRSSESS